MKGINDSFPGPCVYKHRQARLRQAKPGVYVKGAHNTCTCRHDGETTTTTISSECNVLQAVPGSSKLHTYSSRQHTPTQHRTRRCDSNRQHTQLCFCTSLVSNRMPAGQALKMLLLRRGCTLSSSLSNKPRRLGPDVASIPFKVQSIKRAPRTITAPGLNRRPHAFFSGKRDVLLWKEQARQLLLWRPSAPRSGGTRDKRPGGTVIFSPSEQCTGGGEMGRGANGVEHTLVLHYLPALGYLQRGLCSGCNTSETGS